MDVIARHRKPYATPGRSRANGVLRRASFGSFALLLALLTAGSFAGPASAVASSPAVTAAAAGGTPVIKPPKKTPKPLTCTPGTKTKRCVKVAAMCKTTKGIRSCVTQKVTCRRAGKYKSCVKTAVTCTTPKAKKGRKARKRCRRTSTSRLTSRISAGVASGSIARVDLRAQRRTGPPRSPATELVATSGTPTMGATSDPDPGGWATVPAGAGVGVLVLVLALIGLTVTRRPRRRP